MQNIIFKLNNEQTPLISFKGQVSLSTIQHFTVDALMPSHDYLALYNLLGSPASLLLETAQTISGIITHFKTVGNNLASTKPIVRFTLQSSLYKLTQTQQMRIHLHKTAQQIVEQLLPAHGITHWQWQVKKELPNKAYRLQTDQETDFDFMQRILSREGIYFYSSVDSAGNELIIFTDNSLTAPTLMTLSYIKPGNTHVADQNHSVPHIFKFTQQAQHTAKKFMVNDFNADVSEQKIATMTGDMHAEALDTESYYDQQVNNKSQASEHAKLRQQYALQQAITINAKSNDPNLAIGHVLYINANALNSDWTQSYFLTEVQHQASLADQFHHEGLQYHNDVFNNTSPLVTAKTAYQNSFSAIPASTVYRPNISATPKLMPFFTAVVESDSDYPALDNTGKISVRPHFDESDQPNMQALPPIKRLQTSLNPGNEINSAVGTHLPLYAHSEVLLSSEQGDPDRLVVVNSLANQMNPSPVTSQNLTENKFSTTQGHSLVLDDNQQQPAIHLQTDDGFNHLHMDGSEQQPHIELMSQRGNIHSKAGNNSNLETAQDFVQQNHAERNVNIQQQMNTNSVNDSVQLQSAKHFHITSQSDINQSSEKDFQITAGTNIHLNADEDGTYVSQAGNLAIHSNNGKVTIHAKQHCQLIGNGKDEIHIRNGNAGYQIDHSGNINVYGNTVAFNSKNKVIAKGNVKYQANTAPPVFMSPGLPGAMNPATFLSSNPSAKHVIKLDTLQFECYLPKQQSMSYVNETQYRLASILDPNSLILDREKEFEGKIKNNIINLSDIDLDKPWLLELLGTNNKIAMYLIAINGKSCAPTRLIYAKPGQYTMTNQICPDTNVVKRHTKIQLTLLPLPINFNFHLYSKQRMQQMIQTTPKPFQVSKMQQMTTQDWNKIGKTLTFFKDKFRADDPYYRTHCTQEEINYIKNTGNNVTIFIHGFNVTYGKYGEAFDPFFDNDYTELRKNEYYQRVVEEPHIAGFTDLKSTIYRSPENGILQKYSDTFNAKSTDKLVNGTGPHNWWIDLANNLNIATGKFEHKNYEKYTHPIGIAWQGDPKLQNFIADTTMGRYTGLLVASLIKQLHQAGIKINVISHSMGAMVILSAMSLLGQDNISDAIEQVFLWQPAVPNYALSDTQHPSDPDGTFFFPKATTAAKTISVLYSNNDNVLGPIPANQLDQANINATKPLISELLPALFLTKMDYSSIYCMATWAGVPVSDLFDSTQIDNIYQHWIKQHPNDKNGQPFAPTLEEQIEHYKNSPEDFLGTMQEKLSQIYPEVIADIHAAGHTAFAEMMKLGYLKPRDFNPISLMDPLDFSGKLADKLLNVFIDQTLINGVFQKLLTVLDVMFNKSRYNPVMPLGYTGPDTKTANYNHLNNSGKLIHVNQSPWLWSHSGMKVPNSKLMDQVYKKYIIGPKGMSNFGLYY